MQPQDEDEGFPVTLLELLRNTLVLGHISPCLGLANLVQLAATSKSFQDLVYGTAGVFRHADLGRLLPHLFYPSFIQSEATEPEATESESPDQFYSRPIRRVLESLQRRNVLHDIRTLALDGLAVPLTLLTNILCNDAYNVRILSLRGVKELGDEKLIQLLRYIIRPSRPEGTPKLKGLYYFTPLEARADYTARTLVHKRPPYKGITNSLGAQLGPGTFTSSGNLHKHFIESSWHQNDPWYNATGEVLSVEPSMNDEWAKLIQACKGLIAFDAVVCRREPQQHGMVSPHLSPRIAAISLGGCQQCGACPEGAAKPGASPESDLPLLVPPPLHSSSVKAAQRLDTKGIAHPTLIARCRDCVKDRWCERCNVWWCEACYTVPSRRSPSSVTATTTGNMSFERSNKVHNKLFVFTCVTDESLNGVGEGRMWG